MDIIENCKWKRLGRVICPDGEFPWMNSHAQVPRPLLLHDCIRIYFATRCLRDHTGNYISNITYVDVDLDDPTRVIALNDRPLLPLGSRGAFDQHGISPSDVLRVGDDVWLYYGGWSRQVEIPYQIAIGLAISRDGGSSFVKLGEGPVLDRTPTEPYGPNSVCVLHDNGTWRMLYSSILEWDESSGHLESRYILFEATSTDGVNWHRGSTAVVEPMVEFECQCVPTVLRGLNNLHHLWFSCRNGRSFRNTRDGYYLAHAKSTDMERWRRDSGPLDFHHSDDGWDSVMVCYPSVLRVRDRVLLFYCGNEFGKAGFGVAEHDGLI